MTKYSCRPKIHYVDKGMQEWMSSDVDTLREKWTQSTVKKDQEETLSDILKNYQSGNGKKIEELNDVVPAVEKKAGDEFERRCC